MNENKEKLSLRIKRYLKNLVKAFCGRDPYREELEETKKKLEKSAENMTAMQDQLYSALDKWNEVVKTSEDLSSQVESCEKLIENLRERINEKDEELKQQGNDFRERMERMKGDYQKRLDEYNKLVDFIRSNKNVPYEIGVIIDKLTERR